MSESTASGFQLSPQQKHLWLLGAEKSVFHATVALLLEGKLELETLKSALQAVVSRHEILRTTFERRPGMKVPVQVVHENLAPTWEQIDARSLAAGQQMPRIDEVFQREKRRAFALDRGPIVRATLLTLADDKHALVIVLPSLCADSATLRNLVREISESYASQPSSEEVFQYADFSAWHNELLQQEEDEDAKAGKQYWSDLLSDFVWAVKLPFEARPAQVGSFQPESLTIDASAELPEQFANDPASFYAACWQVLQWRLTGQTGIVVGYLCDGRNHEEVAGAMGLFARSLPIPYEFHGNRPFTSVIQGLQKARTRAYEEQDYLALDETTQDLSIFFVGEELPAKHSARNLSFSILKQESNSQRFHMQLRLVISFGSCALELNYDPQYFSRSAAERVARSLTVLIKSAIQKSSAAIADLAIMSDAERQQVVSEFNRTAADYPRDKCIHYLFEEQ